MAVYPGWYTGQGVHMVVYTRVYREDYAQRGVSLPRENREDSAQRCLIPQGEREDSAQRFLSFLRESGRTLRRVISLLPRKSLPASLRASQPPLGERRDPSAQRPPSFPKEVREGEDSAQSGPP